MEFCRVCGGAGVHRSDCPAAPPAVEREVVPGFSDNEVDQLVRVRDFEKEIDPSLVERVDADNIEAIIDAGEKIIVDERDRTNEPLRNSSLAKTVRANADRNCASHAIQCSIDRGMDYQIAVDKVDELPDNLSEEAEAKEIRGFFAGHVEMNRELTELYKLEIARRLGRLKADREIFDCVAEKFPVIAVDIEKSLDDYEQSNQEFLNNDEEQRERIASFREKLQELKGADADKLEQGIVELAEDFSRIQFYDSEPKLDDLIAKAKKISSLGF